MKRCPECRREYDTTMMFCLDDGAELLYGPALSVPGASVGGQSDEPPTAILHEIASPSEAATRHQIHSTAQERLSRPTKARYKMFAFGILAFAAVAAVGLGYKYSLFSTQKSSSLLASPQNLKFTRLTSGQISDVAISPDGKYAAYSTLADDKASIRLRQIATTTDVEIVAPIVGSFLALNFSPDSNYLYYAYVDGGAGGESALYRIPALGGPPAKLADTMLYRDTAVSPDGRSLAYIGRDPTKPQSHLRLAKPDGSDEQSLVKLDEPDGFSPGLAWSPDGKDIAYCGETFAEGKRSRKIVGVRVTDGSQRPLSDQNWDRCNSIVWLPDGNLLVSGSAGSGGSESAPVSQLWLIVPGSPPQRITNDLNGYSNVTATANGDVLLAGTSKRISNLWVAPETDAAQAMQVPNSGDVYIVNWTPDGNLVYASRGRDIWTMNVDGTGQKQLTSDQGENFHPSMTPDGRNIIFMSTRVGGVNHIFRMDADGRNQRQLTDGAGENFPRLSPDGKTIYYQAVAPNADAMSICKIPIDGGEPVVVARVPSDLRTIDVSPGDGSVGYRHVERGEEKSGARFSIISPNGGDVLKTLKTPPTAHATFRWMPDGRAIAFQDSRAGGSNLWSITLDGKGEAKPLTNFKGETMDFSFAWSADGKRLAVIRYSRVTDAVLITGKK